MLVMSQTVNCGSIYLLAQLGTPVSIYWCNYMIIYPTYYSVCIVAAGV